MADENYRSNRTGEAFARAAQPAYPSYAQSNARPENNGMAPGDPLAELARLIGQNDPFADFGRAPAPRDSYAEAPAPQAYHPPAPAHTQSPAYPAAPALSPAYANEPHYTDRYDQTAFEDPNAAQAHTHQQGAYQSDAYQPVHAGTEYETQGYAPANDAADTYQPNPFYGAERGMPAASDDYEEDVPPSRRRGGLGIVVGIVALALVGTGAAYGYRTLVSGSSGSSAPPPVIKADGTPNKVVPASSGDSQSGKMTDRIGDTGQGERMVSREEKPVDIKDASRPGQQPRVIFPPPANQGAQTPGTSALASAPSSFAEPKRVRTEVIRPDRPIGPETNVQPGAPSQNTRSAAPSPAPRAAAPAPSDNGPLSLAPQNGQQPAARTRTAAAPAAAPAATSASGAYAVQISSQRSEGEAQASFRSLQAKYPSVLGGQSPLIRRADLGDKGIYFRALVGPYATAEQATTLCGNLKAAGGTCVVQRN